LFRKRRVFFLERKKQRTFDFLQVRQLHKMKLVQYLGAVPNFGDDLNAVLWRSLAPGLIDDDPRNGFVGIGTIIGMDCDPALSLHVFSSGAGNDPVDKWAARSVRYWCVRGPLTCALLNLSPETAITDGAILTPLADGFPKAGSAGSATLVIPHFQTLDFPGWDEVAAQTGFELLDPRDDPHAVIARIASARLVLTESLHGAILADTYGIPWRVFGTSGNFGSTKFWDWCQSLGIPFYLSYVPPPHPGHILQHGKGPCVWGETVELTREQAIAAFERRVAPPGKPGLRAQVKAQIQKFPPVQKLLSCSPTRTAEALTRLAAGEPQLSPASVRQTLQDRMMERLAEISFYR
jgi:succinoglycan biosynthesis protein ExoV